MRLSRLVEAEESSYLPHDGSNERSAFLQDIQGAPYDWGPKLMYADWLEERGNPVGEIIQIAGELFRELENAWGGDITDRFIDLMDVLWSKIHRIMPGSGSDRRALLHEISVILDKAGRAIGDMLLDIKTALTGIAHPRYTGEMNMVAARRFNDKLQQKGSKFSQPAVAAGFLGIHNIDDGVSYTMKMSGLAEMLRSQGWSIYDMVT